MPASKSDWSRAYAKQALSDLRARDVLISRAERCHHLHYLQMAAEKTCKAFLAASQGQQVKRSHACAEKHLPAIARNFYAQIESKHTISQGKLSGIKKLARQIDLLAPAVKTDYREDNTEYPWEAQGNIHIPCAWKFPNIDDGDRSIVDLIRLMRTAAEAYASA